MNRAVYKEFNKKSYDKIAAEYLENTSSKEPEYLRGMLQNLPAKLKILDLGCGPGNLVPLLQSLDPELIVCIDNSHQMIVLAKNKYPKTNLKFTESDYMQFQSTDKFDLIIAHLSFVHLPAEDLTDMLEKVKSLSKPGAWFFANYFVAPENDFKLVKLDYKAGRDESRYFAFYSPKYLKKCYQKAGFVINIENIYQGRHFKRYNLLARWAS